VEFDIARAVFGSARLRSYIIQQGIAGCGDWSGLKRLIKRLRLRLRLRLHAIDKLKIDTSCDTKPSVLDANWEGWA
jgi:hypothetical protein